MSELVDLVNWHGEVVERGVLREQADGRDDLYMQIVIVVITNGAQEVLVHRRAATKKVNAGHIDHVCGGLISGETPKEAAIREAAEEVGVIPEGLKAVREGVNMYRRYCYLFVGTANAPIPENLDPKEVEWAAYIGLDDLKAKAKSGELTFVDGFFEDLDAALAQ